MLKPQSLRKSMGSLMVGQIINYLIVLVQIPYLTRHLSPEGFGIYAFANTLMLVGVNFIGYAVNTSSTFLFRKYVNSPVRRSLVFWNQLGVQIILAVTASALMLAWIALSTELRKDGAVYLILIASFFFTAIYSPWVLAALEKFRVISMLITGSRILTLALMVLTVRDPGDVAWAFAAVILPNTLAAVGIYTWALRSGAVRPVPIRRWRPLMVLRRDFFIAMNIYAAIAFSYVGIILAKFLIEAHEYGLIAFADRFRWIAQIILPTFGTVLFSRYCGERAMSVERGAAFGRKSAIVLALFGLAIGLGLAVLIKPAILVLGGRAFLPAAVPLLIVAATIPLIAINYYLTYFVVNVFDLGRLQLIVFVMAGVAVALALVLRQHATPTYVMAVIGTGELVRAVFSWAIIHASGMHVFRPGLRRDSIKTEA